MKREELIKFLDWYDELPWQIQLISHEDTADKYLSTLPDEKEECESVIDFAFRIATSLKESQSSTALFFLQQAYPEDVDGLDQMSSNDILDNIITLTSILKSNQP